jgi:hypothetical protein
MAVQVPVAGIEEVEPAKLQPGPPIVGRRGEVVAQEVDGHLALALALERGRSRGHVRVDGALRRQARRPGKHQHDGEKARRMHHVSQV